MPARQIELVRTLPPKLSRFLERFPPRIYGKNATAASPSSTIDSSRSELNASSQAVSSIPSSISDLKNPFQRHLHPATGRWHEPMYSLRRQADLVKLAKQHGIEELLPFTVKGTEEQLAYRREKGIRVKGTGVGQKVKGHKDERTMRRRLDKRRQAMLDMPKMIYEWRQVSLVDLLGVIITNFFSAGLVLDGRNTPNRFNTGEHQLNTSPLRNQVAASPCVPQLSWRASSDSR